MHFQNMLILKIFNKLKAEDNVDYLISLGGGRERYLKQLIM